METQREKTLTHTSEGEREGGTRQSDDGNAPLERAAAWITRIEVGTATRSGAELLLSVRKRHTCRTAQLQ